MPQLDPAEWIGLIALLIFLFVLAVVLTRWIFQVGKQLKYQQTIVDLLMKIASEEKLTQDQKDGIKNYLERS